MWDSDDPSNFREYSFSAWGIPRNPSDWTQAPTEELINDRGFTGHEHLTKFELIDMNGRVYDPVLGRFLSVDPYVQMPDFREGFNRYSYCLNNPLIYTDPSGEFIFTALAVLTGQLWALPITIGADFGAVTGGIRGAQDPNVGFWKGAGRGALVGGVGGGLSMIGGAGMPFATNLLLGTAEGAITGGLDAALWGNDIGKGMLWGAAGGAVFTTLTSENFSNWTKGEKFLTNENVFHNMDSRGMDRQGILDYFGFEGKYIDEEGVSSFWFDKNDPNRFGIRYRNSSFDSYETLHSSYLKESFHLNRYAKGGLNGLELGNSGFYGLDRWPEERLGAIYQYKNQGLLGEKFNFLNSIKTSESFISSFNLSKDYNPAYLFNAFDKKWWHIIYTIPRRW
jgi:RHS repeat-associated protein